MPCEQYITLTELHLGLEPSNYPPPLRTTASHAYPNRFQPLPTRQPQPPTPSTAKPAADAGVLVTHQYTPTLVFPTHKPQTVASTPELADVTHTGWVCHLPRAQIMKPGLAHVIALSASIGFHISRNSSNITSLRTSKRAPAYGLRTARWQAKDHHIMPAVCTHSW